MPLSNIKSNFFLLQNLITLSKSCLQRYTALFKKLEEIELSQGG